MASLADLFNPTFFLFLGILVLVVALIIVYFESKIRVQNHKITSMLSLVSTLAEDMNGVKINLNNLIITKTGGSSSQKIQQPLENYTITESIKLIEVSDNEDEDNEDEDEDDDDEDEDDDESILELSDNEETIIRLSDNENQDVYEDEEESILELSDNHDYIKVLKINLKQNNDYDKSLESNNLELQHLDDDDNNDDNNNNDDNHDDNNNDDNNNEELSNELSEHLKEKLPLVQEKESEIFNISSTEFKTININLEETEPDLLDFKKQSLQKLRSIVSEKGLASDTSKLKKNELLKLLGIE